MKTICLYFQAHQPVRIRKYRFFDIGNEHHYWDDYTNKSMLRKIAEKCYLPANRMFLQMIHEWGTRFKITYSISGALLDQFQMYAPDVLESFKRLADTGCVEFLGETYSHSLSSLKSKGEFFDQVQAHSQTIERLFGQKPKVFRNTELIYSDSIGDMVADMGFKAIISEGAKLVLGWKSPNFVYCNAINPKLRVLLRNVRMSDDISRRFSNMSWSEWPLTSEKFILWLLSTDTKEEIFNIFMDYETFGERHGAETGIFEFFRDIPRVALANNVHFSTASEVATNFDPVGAIHVPYPISWSDEEKDLTSWLGNELQDEAFSSLYDLHDIVKNCGDPQIQRDWKYLQVSDHFYYMCTKWFSDGGVQKYYNPYNSPYEAYINYMNVLSDFIDRLNKMNLKPVSVSAVADTDINEKYVVPAQTTTAKAKAKTPAKPTAKKNVEPEKKAVDKKAIPVKKTEDKEIPAIKTKVAAAVSKTEKIIEPKKETKPKPIAKKSVAKKK